MTFQENSLMNQEELINLVSSQGQVTENGKPMYSALITSNVAEIHEVAEVKKLLSSYNTYFEYLIDGKNPPMLSLWGDYWPFAVRGNEICATIRKNEDKEKQALEELIARENIHSFKMTSVSEIDADEEASYHFQKAQCECNNRNGEEGFVMLLKGLAGYIKTPLIIQAVCYYESDYPMRATEWIVRPGATDIEINGFRFQGAIEDVFSPNDGSSYLALTSSLRYDSDILSAMNLQDLNGIVIRGE